MDIVSLIVQTLKSLFGFLGKAIPSDKIREDRHELKKPRLAQKEKIIIFDREFRRLKNHPEIPIELNIEYVADNLNEEDQQELIALLTARITEYRKKRPVIFRKWLKEQNLK